MTEKVKSICTIEQFIDGNWVKNPIPQQLEFIVWTNGSCASEEDLLGAANAHVEFEMGKTFRVTKAEGQVFFGDACGPKGTEGVSGDKEEKKKRDSWGENTHDKNEMDKYIKHQEKLRRIHSKNKWK